MSMQFGLSDFGFRYSDFMASGTPSGSLDSDLSHTPFRLSRKRLEGRGKGISY